MNTKQLKEQHGFSYLLNIDANPKTVKGQKRGYMTAILYLAPAESAGFNVCPMAKLAGCIAGCLNTAGHGGMHKTTFAPYGVELPENNVQRARIARTRFYVEHRAAFFLQLEREIIRFVKRAEKKGLTPCIRLNGTSDILWEKERAEFGAHLERTDCTIFERFEEIQFYDYTKIAKRFERTMPANYYLCLSYSEASTVYALRCMDAAKKYGASLVVVARDEETKRDVMIDFANQLDVDCVDGDEHDLRFTDTPGAVVVLKAKGSARKDTSGFVID